MDRRKWLALSVGLMLSPFCRAGSIELRADRGGHFHIDGFVGRAPIRFLIDTGASGVVIPRRIANEAGDWGSCSWSTHSTANGTVDLCRRKVAALSFGPFVMKDVDATITTDESTAGNGLLGMSVLRFFRVELQNGVMRLTG